MRKKIRITLPQPPPPPPDTTCDLCGGAMPGWRTSKYDPIGICYKCDAPWGNFPAFKRINEWLDTPMNIGAPRRAAAVVLWHMEREIDRQTARVT